MSTETKSVLAGMAIVLLLALIFGGWQFALCGLLATAFVVSVMANGDYKYAEHRRRMEWLSQEA